MSGQFMLIDGMPVEINGEKNILEKQESSCLPSVIIQSFPYTVPAVYV